MADRVSERVEATHRRYDRLIDRAREALRRRVKRWRRDERRKVAAIRRGATELSEDGVAFIASWEGFRSRPYKPVSAEAHWTWGFGHYGPDVPPPSSGRSVTRARALELLEDDCAIAEAAVRRLVDVRLEPDEFDVLVSFTFNCGVGALETSTLLRELNAGHKGRVPDELMKWVRGANGEVIQGLVNRRAAEARKWRD